MRTHHLTARHFKALLGLGGAGLMLVATAACNDTGTTGAAVAPTTTTTATATAAGTPTTAATTGAASAAPGGDGGSGTAASSGSSTSGGSSGLSPSQLEQGVKGRLSGLVPTLGVPWAPGQEGYGQVKPTTISNGGDPTGIVSNVAWSSWGGPTATATGVSDYVGPGQSVAQGSEKTATVVAFGLGLCDAKPVYEKVEWYFAGEGQHFDPNTYIDICTGQYHGM